MRIPFYPQAAPFDGMKAAVHALDARKASFQRLLRLGGATVLEEACPPFSNLKDATHIIAEPNKMPKVSVDYESLAIQGIAVVSPLYLNEYLIADPKPPVDNFLVEPFKPHWDKRKLHRPQ